MFLRECLKPLRTTLLWEDVKQIVNEKYLVYKIAHCKRSLTRQMIQSIKLETYKNITPERSHQIEPFQVNTKIF